MRMAHPYFHGRCFYTEQLPAVPWHITGKVKGKGQGLHLEIRFCLKVWDFFIDFCGFCFGVFLVRKKTSYIFHKLQGKNCTQPIFMWCHAVVLLLGEIMLYLTALFVISPHVLNPPVLHKEGKFFRKKLGTKALWIFSDCLLKANSCKIVILLSTSSVAADMSH